MVGENLPITLNVPLFPLPRVVLFPAVRLPFYVFEQRYRAMLRDVLDGAGLIGVPQVLPGFEASSTGSTPFAQVFGVGEVVDYVTHGDGTSHIEVVGVHRVRFMEETTADIYRSARVEVLDEPDASSEVAGELHQRLASAVRALLPLVVPPDAQESMERILSEVPASLPALVNTLATVLVADARVRQTLMETEGVAPRASQLANMLDDIRHSLLERAAMDAPEEPGNET